MAHKEVLNVFFSGVPANHPPAIPIRHVDVAVGLGLFVSCVVSLAIAWMLWHALPGSPIVPPGGLIWQWLHYPTLLLWQIKPHAPMTLWADNPASYAVSPWAIHARLLPGLLIGGVVGGLALKAGLAPYSRMRHLEGPKLILDPKEALQELVRASAEELAGKVPFMQLLPGVWLPKQRWTRGVLLYGSPGSGKTQALIPILQQLIDGNHRTWAYDVKGDLTSYWLGGTVGLLCPQDRRSLVWDIGADVRTPSDAQVFASSLIGEAGGEGKFWSEAAKSLLEGTLISLQNELATNWGWRSLADRLTADAPAFAERMAKHAPLAALLVADAQSSTTSSVLATLSAYTKIVHDLARAWGDGMDDAGRMPPSISLRAWASDGFDGSIRQLIYQAGPDRAMTTALGQTMLNMILPVILSAATPDDELGRTIALVVDELASLPVQFLPAIERGRSKGLIWVSAVQTLDQITEGWSEEVARSLGSMIGTHLVFRIQPSPGRDSVADQFGKARWAITAVSTSSSGQSTSLHEENRAVVAPHELSELGSIKDKKLPLGWGVTAIVAGIGPNLMRVTFPGVTPKKRRTPHRPAKWTLGPAQPGMTPEMTKVERDAKVARIRAENEEKQKERQAALEAKRASREGARNADAEWRAGGRKPAGNRANFAYEKENKYEPEPGLDHEAPPFPPAPPAPPLSAADRLRAEGKTSPLAKLSQTP
jgi:hypothetical protein